ncbi:PA2778 family cysteine peptidase [Methylibium sp.]|uniref:PA2778 family cysteine peptidase n=1 Tax=Methylibium sp. TaxID=2067992 RepID=UPI0025DAB537|nr:PA2778 family cysteine peptidase [Methylibium sp.]
MLTPPQTQALLAAPPSGMAESAELRSVPFFPQTEYECGPAALATVLTAAGIAARPEALVEHVYLPARKGSLQLEMLATARREGAVAVRLPPTLEALLREVAAGHPVVVLQNLGLAIAPTWHYAVVVGYDLAAREMVLRSGTTEREVLSLRTFEHTWRRSGHWAFVALPPGRLPASASENEVTAASVAFERSAEPQDARRAYEAALRRWPESLTLAMGLGNTRVAAGDLPAATATFKAAAQRHDSTPAWINLAELHLQQSHFTEAEAAARRAITRSVAEPNWRAAAEETLTRVLEARR